MPARSSPHDTRVEPRAHRHTPRTPVAAFLLAALLFALATTANAQLPEPSREYNGVFRVLSAYVDALDRGDGPLVRELLVPDAPETGTTLLPLQIDAVAALELGPVQLSDDHAVVGALLWMLPNAFTPPGWSTGENRARIELERHGSRWLVSRVDPEAFPREPRARADEREEREAAEARQEADVTERPQDPDDVLPDGTAARSAAEASERERVGPEDEAETAGTDEPAALDDAVCLGLREELRAELGVPVLLEWADDADAATGACRLQAFGTGEQFGHFIDVATNLRIALLVDGWTDDFTRAADGPTETAMGFRRAAAQALLHVGWTPDDDADCPDDVPIFLCEIEPADQRFTVTLEVSPETEPVDARSTTEAPMPVSPVEALERPAGQVTTNGEPAAAASARRDLARRLGADGARVDTADIELVRYEGVEWPDACLGIHEPDVLCAQVVTPGYRIELEYEGRRYVYHTDRFGDVVRLRDEPLGLQAPEEDALLEWRREGPDGCDAAAFAPDGVRAGPCGGELATFPYGDPAAAEQLLEFSRAFGSVEVATPAGSITLRGSGERAAGRADHRRIAEWASLTAAEAASGRALAGQALAFAWHRSGGAVGRCDTLDVYLTGVAYASSCRGPEPVTVARVTLEGDELEQLYAWVDTFRSWENDSETAAASDAPATRIAFQGRGFLRPNNANMHSVEAYAAALYERLTR